MRELILLGAGASVEAGVPDTFGMTREMLARIGGSYAYQRYSRVIRFAVGGLLFQRGIQGEDPFEGINIEELFNAVQLLGERESLEAAPFIGSWHPLVEELDRIAPSQIDLGRLLSTIEKSVVRAVADAGKRGLGLNAGDKIDRYIETFLKGNRPFDKLGRLVVDLVRDAFEKMQPISSGRNSDFDREMTKAIERKDRRGQGLIFRRTNQLMIQMLAQMVFVQNPDKVNYLAPLLGPDRRDPTVIATLNYDNTVELAATRYGIDVHTGIDNWSKTGQFPIIDHGVTLLKLHGSIDWALRDGTCSTDRPLPFQQVEKLSPEHIQSDNFLPALIFGSRNKLTASGPFLDLLRLFQAELMQSDRLTIIGYSFRDDHVNEYIAQWINSDLAKKLRVINGPEFGNTRLSFARQLIQLLGSRIEIIELKAADGIKACYGS